MGIRINKKLGFILQTNQAIDFTEIENMSILDFKNKISFDSLPVHEQFKMSIDLLQVSDSDVIENYVYNVETSEENQVYTVFTVPSQDKEWSRYNNIIDYYENQKLTKPVVNYINEEILPFKEQFINSKNKELINLDCDIYTRSLCLLYDTLSKEQKKHLQSIDLELNEFTKDNIYMSAPIFIRMLCKILKIEYTELRPGIITYWS